MLAHKLHLFEMLYTDARFASMFKTMDRLHDAVCEGRLDQMTPLNTEDVVGWLQDIAYTIQETINEIEAQKGGRNA